MATVTTGKVLLQVPLYAALALLVGYFSAAPAYRPLAPDRALVKLSLVHAGERLAACRTRTPEELAKLAPNMRAELDCPRERSRVRIVLEMDGQPIAEVDAPPSGLRGDLPSTIYRRVEVPSGRHAFVARMADDASGKFRHRSDAVIDLAAGRVLVVDFAPGKGWVFAQGKETP